MRIYIIHSSDKEENYIDKVVATEQKLIMEGHHVINPLPEEGINIDNVKMNRIHGNLIPYCDMVYAMEGWDEFGGIGNVEMAEAMKCRKDIRFEQKQV